MKKISHSRILITGGAGFIGSNLANILVKDNDVVVVDDLSMGKIENLPRSAHLHFFKHTITDSTFMSKILLKWDFDYIFLLAAVASVADTIVRPLETHMINQDANINILETIRLNELPVKKILFSSSAAVYGNNPELPKIETSPINPISPYAIDKFASERFVISYGNLYHIPTVATRFFNVYGPKQNPESPYSGVISLIKQAIIRNKTFTIFGDGEQTRDFIYIDDVINALILLMTSKSALHDVYNVATGEKNSLNDIINIFGEIVGQKISVVNAPPRIGDIVNSYADITKIINEGFRKKHSMKDGLNKYWNSFN